MAMCDSAAPGKYIQPAIRHNYTKILENLQAGEILPFLFEEEIVTNREKQEIMKQEENKGSIAMADYMLSLVLEKEPRDLVGFLEILKSKQPGIYSIINTTTEEMERGKLEVKVDQKSNPRMCELHQSQPAKYYCRTCGAPHCSDCHATAVHRKHDTETIEHALNRIIPGIMKQAKTLADQVGNYQQAISDLNAKINDAKKHFDTCEFDVNQAAEERIRMIRDAQVALEYELKEQREKSVDQLEAKSFDLYHKLKLKQGLLTSVTNCLQQSEEEQCLDQLMEMENKVKDEANKIDQLSASYALPKLNRKKDDENMLGKLVCSLMSLFWMTGSVLEVCTPTIRTWNTSFKNVFENKLSKINEIHLAGLCSRVSVIGSKLWAPLRMNDSIVVYNKDGTKHQHIPIASPRSVAMTHIGDILVACADKGMVKVNQNFTTSKVSDGSFGDLSVFNDSVYTWEYKSRQVIQFQKENHVWNAVKYVNINCVKALDGGETLLATSSIQTEGSVQFFIGSFLDSVVYQVSACGQLIQQFRASVSWQVLLSVSRVFICGKDLDNNILVADRTSQKYVLWNPTTNESKVVFSTEGWVRDLILDEDDSVWVVHEPSRGRYSIVQYKY